MGTKFHDYDSTGFATVKMFKHDVAVLHKLLSARRVSLLLIGDYHSLRKPGDQCVATVMNPHAEEICRISREDAEKPIKQWNHHLSELARDNDNIFFFDFHSLF